MKKLTLVAAAAALSLTAFGQNVERTAPNVRMNADAPVRHLNPAQLAAFYGAETPVWSQDFANGIPTTWLNYGTAAGSSDPDAKWEYRGTSTTPSNTVGSRGAYMSAQTPIASATASNGFVVFDSDFLDNAGVAGNFGNGIAAAPHLAELTTDMIDLSNYSVVDLLFTQYYRRFAGAGGSQAVPATYIDFSTDGGTTFPYSVTLNSGVAVNSSTATNDVVVVQAGAYVGGQDSVKVRFRFDGDYYFWCVDDISIVNTPPNRMAFTDWQGAPAQDIIYGPSASGSSKMGIMTAKQSRGVTFDCNAINSGTNTQTNVKLQMKIYNGGSLVQTVNSSTVSSLAAGDTANYNDLNTYSTAWTPTANGSYEVVYGLLSDSVSVYSDTTMLYVNDSLLSMDFNSWDNSIGASTNATQWGDGAQMCNRHDLVDDEMLFGAKVYLSSLTMSGAILELAVYDSSAFLGNSGGWDANKLVAYGQQVISAADTALGFVRFDFTDPTTGRGVDLEVAKGAYFYNLTMYDNQAANYLAIRNDQTWAKTAGSGYMYLAAVGSWYSGFTGSKSFNNLWVRGIHCPAASAAACMGIGMDEQAMEQIVMSPNPASEFVNLNFGLAMGDYHVAIVDFTGKVMKNEVVRADANVSIFIGDLTSGMYMVRVQKGDDVKTMKLSVL
ncbi:MAG: T9SS type A sorting domain-containing protein [Cryomorphaceae bacterium]